MLSAQCNYISNEDLPDYCDEEYNVAGIGFATASV